MKEAGRHLPSIRNIFLASQVPRSLRTDKDVEGEAEVLFLIEPWAGKDGRAGRRHFCLLELQLLLPVFKEAAVKWRKPISSICTPCLRFQSPSLTLIISFFLAAILWSKPNHSLSLSLFFSNKG